MLRSLSRSTPIFFCIPSNDTFIRSCSRSTINSIPNASRTVSILSYSASKGFEVKAETHGRGPTPASASPSLSMFSALSNHEEAAELLPASNDTHGGVVVDMKRPMDPEAFVSSLRVSIAHWRKQVVALLSLVGGVTAGTAILSFLVMNLSMKRRQRKLSEWAAL